jgi:hypothetical protein
MFAVVMTGSCRTYDAIVWGNPDAREWHLPGLAVSVLRSLARAAADQKKDGKQRVKKPVKAELGSVNPWIIVP